MQNNDIKYCVTSFTDLLGFSNHLEIGKDLRTKIGQEVINRLHFLENSIEQFLAEKKKYSKYYPKNINYKRINDSLILTLDLPEFLKPRIGENVKGGMTGNEIEKFFSEQELDTYETFEKANNEKLTQSIIELTQFIGLVARIHSFINRKENENCFPGAKTVIASGYRKSFIMKSNKEDYFSANFSFSNAYVAESFLKGQKLFIDNYILQILGSNQYIKNILKIASFIYKQYTFDPFDDNTVSLESTRKYIKGNVTEINLFRKKYLFRELNPTPLAYLQLFATFLPFLNGQQILKVSKKKKYLHRRIFYNFKNKVTTNEISENPNRFFLSTFDIEDNIEINKQLILTEKSSILDKQNKKDMELKFPIVHSFMEQVPRKNVH